MTFVIELPHNTTQGKGDGALVIDVDIFPDNKTDGKVELSTGKQMLEFNNMTMNWSAAEEFCVSKGGHLASVASPSDVQKMKDFVTSSVPEKVTVWLGGTDEATEGEWAWSDGSKWSAEYWRPDWPRGGPHWNCMYSSRDYAKNGSWGGDYGCNSEFHSICSVPSIKTLASSAQLVFT